MVLKQTLAVAMNPLLGGYETQLARVQDYWQTQIMSVAIFNMSFGARMHEYLIHCLSEGTLSH